MRPILVGACSVAFAFLLSVSFQIPTASAVSNIDGVWSALDAAAAAPGARREYAAVYDSFHHRYVMFAGFTNEPGNGYFLFNEVWVLTLDDAPTWTVLPIPGGTPGPRHSPQWGYDPARNRLLVFGGYGLHYPESAQYEYLNDVWELSLDDAPYWNELAASGTPPTGRLAGAAVYDVLHQRFVGFGGTAGLPVDTWQLDLRSEPVWSTVATDGLQPVGSYGMTSIFDSVRNRMLIFGGSTSAGYYGTHNDTWELDLSPETPRCLGVGLPHREVYGEQIRLLLGYQAPGLRRWGESFLSTFLFQVHPFLSAAALASIWVAIRRRDLRWAIVAWPVLLLIGLEVRRIRYLLPAFPMLALMAAHGLRVLRARDTRRLVLATAVLSSLAVAFFGYLPFLRSTSAANLRSAGEYLDAIGVDRVLVRTVSRDGPEVNPAVSVALLDLFTAKRLVYRDEGIPPPAGQKARESALRFTWELGIPPWYAPDGTGGKAAIAVISDDAGRPLPEELATLLAGRRPARTFAADEGVFGYRTLVDVYLPSDADPPPP